MLTNKDIYEELEAAEKIRTGLKDESTKTLIKLAVLQTKILHNIRTNIVTVMKHMGVKLVEPSKDREEVVK